MSIKILSLDIRIKKIYPEEPSRLPDEETKVEIMCDVCMYV